MVEVPHKIKNRTYDPAIPLLGVYPKEMKTLTQKDKGTPTFILALFTVAKTHTHTLEYYSIIIKKKTCHL